MPRNTLTAAALGGLLTLAACGGGSGGGNGGDGPITDLDELLSDPRVARAQGIVTGATALLVPASYMTIDYTASDGSASRLPVNAAGTCSGLQCTMSWFGGSFTFGAHDLALLFGSAEVADLSARLGSRAGMDTVQADATVDVTIGSLSSRQTGTTYAMWGEYGYASAITGAGPVSGTVQGQAVSGTIEGVTTGVLGRPTGFNPTGLGSATWTGPAEALSTATYQRSYGTATITMDDLSVPAVDVDVDIAGRSIGSSAWDSIPLTNGRFAAGAHGHDHLVGHFFGPQHEETYGVFNTGAYVGAFGAKRDE